MTDNTPSIEQIVAFASGDLDPGEASALERGLSEEDGRRALARVRRLLAALSQDADAGPSAAALHRAYRALSERRRGALRDWLSTVRTVAAELVFDSRASGALPGLRGGLDGAHLSMASDELELELRLVEGDGGDVRLIGYADALGEGEATAAIAMHAETRAELARAPIDPSGSFGLSAPPGSWQVIVELDDGESAIVSPAFDARAR